MVTSPKLTENAVTILRTRYLQQGETPEGLFRRVANAIAAPEIEKDFWADQFYDLMADCVFMPKETITVPQERKTNKKRRQLKRT